MESRKRHMAEKNSLERMRRTPPTLTSSYPPGDDVFFKWTSTSPWDHYQRDSTLEPGCDLAFLKKYPHTVVLIRQVDIPTHGVANLKSTVHRNLVQLHRVYIEKSSLSMVYELTVASLSDILSFRPHWGRAETAAVCHSMLSALNYLHNSLHISYGSLSVENIRLDLNGTIKLANIGESLLHAKRQYKDDIRSLVSIIKLISGTSDWKADSDLLDFLRKLSGGQPASVLLQHQFLGHSHGAEQLRHCVWIWLFKRIGS